MGKLAEDKGRDFSETQIDRAYIGIRRKKDRPKKTGIPYSGYLENPGTAGCYNEIIFASKPEANKKDRYMVKCHRLF